MGVCTNRCIFFQEVTSRGFPGCIIDVNENICKILGYTKREICKKTLLELCVPQDKEKIPQYFKKLIQKKNLQFPIHFLCKNGDVQTFDIDAQLIDFKEIRIAFFMSLDQVSLLPDQDLLRDRAEKYRLLIENMDEGVVITQDDRFIFFNRRFGEMMGYNAEELEKEGMRLIYTTRGIQILKERKKKKSEGENVPSAYETIFKKKDGKEIIVEINVAIVEYGGKPATFAVIRNITSRKKVENELKRVHEIYRKAIENAQGVPYRFSYSDDTYEFIGEGCETLLGVSSEELKVRDSWDIVKDTIVTDPDAPLDPKDYIKAFRKGDVSKYKTDIRIVTSSCEEKWINDCAIPIYDEKTHEVVGSLGILQDITDRKRVEEELKRVQKIYRVAIENAQGVPYFLNYKTDTYEFFGDGSRELLGVSPKELTHKQNIKNLVQEAIFTDPAAQTVNREDYINAILRGEHTHYKADVRIITPQGKEKWLSDSTVSVVDEKTGKVIGALGILQDITHRKRSEEELKNIHQIYREAIENAQGVPYRLNYPEGKYEFIGEGCEELLGISPENFTVETLKNMIQENVIIDSHAPADFNEYIKAFLKGDIKRYKADLRIVTPGGQEKWLSDCSVKILDDKSGEVIGMLGILQDITERKKTEEELRKLHKIYQVAIENAHGVPYCLNFNDYSYDFVGQGCEQLLGIPAKQLNFRNFADLSKERVVTDPDAPSDPPEYGKAFRNGKMERFKLDLRIVTPDGQEKWISDCAVPIRDEKTGKIIGSLGILQDITDRKKAEGVLKNYAQRLEDMVEKRTRELRDVQEKLVRKEKLALLGQLAGGVGHELRNPLSVINNAIYYLKVIQSNADDNVKEYLDLIESEVHDAERIVSDLMDFSRTKPIEREEILMTDLLCNVLEKQPPPKKIEIAKQVAPNLPTIFIDPRQISQVLANLLSNAYQAMPEGGGIELHLSCEDDSVLLKIADSGKGIPPENLKKIFEPLFTTKRRGIGLGLSVTKNLVEANGGSISLKSKVGKGSVFTLSFPAHK